MPKNIIGGKKFKKGKKLSVEIVRKYPTIKTLQQEYKNSDSDDFCYGKVISLLGGKQLSLINTSTNEEMLGIICGSMYKKVWIKVDDYVLCAKRIGLDRDIKQKKYDVIFKYNAEEVVQLIKDKEIVIEKKKDGGVIETIFESEDENENENLDENLDDFIDDI